jgi:hypothetical protein
MEEEELSSRLTPFLKFVVPPAWLILFVGLAAVSFVSPESLGGDPALVRERRWILVGVVILGAVLLLWAFVPLVRVSLAGEEFVISNYRRTIRVPVHDVEHVSTSLLLVPELIWLRFRRPTELGGAVTFAAKLRLFPGYTHHPLCARLRQIVAGSAS